MKRIILTLALSLALAASAVAQGAHHIISGTITKVDAAAKTVTIKTKDGAEMVVSETGKAIRQGAQAAKVGGQAVIEYTEEGGKKIVESVKYVAAGTVHETKGVVTAIDRGAKTITIKTASGAEEVYSVAEDGVVTAGKATGHAGVQSWDAVAGATKKGTEVTVYSTEVAGKKVAHAIAHVF